MSLAWGYWRQSSGMTAGLQAADIARVGRIGILSMSSEQGLALLDAALGRPEALLAAVRLDLGRVAAAGETAPPLFRRLVRTRRAATDTAVASSFAQRILSLPEGERERALLDLVRGEIGSVLGLASPSQLEIDRPLQEIGLDSLMAVEIRNKLSGAIGWKLPATLLFDHPTLHAISQFIYSSVVTSLPPPESQYAINDDEVRSVLISIPVARLRASGLLQRILTLADSQEKQEIQTTVQGAIKIISAMDIDELVKFATRENRGSSDE
jgi:acyl carrier protein